MYIYPIRRSGHDTSVSMGRHTGRQKAQELSDAGSNPVPWVGCQVAYFLGMTLRTRSAWSSLSLLPEDGEESGVDRRE